VAGQYIGLADTRGKQTVSFQLCVGSFMHPHKPHFHWRRKMKYNRKSLVISMLACMAATEASAQSVQVYGLIGAYVGSFKRSGDSDAVKQLGGGGLTTSFLGFKGEEDLGGGMKTIFALESFFRPDTGEQGRNATDPFFSRNAYVGFEGNAGRLTFGRQTNPTYAAMSQLSPFGNSVVFSPLTLQSFVATYGSNIVGDTVWNNVIQYQTPTTGGFRGSLLYGMGEVAGHTGVANMGLHGTFVSGKFLAILSAQRVRVNNLTPLPTQQDAWLAGATYDFGPVRVYGSAEHTKIEGTRKNRLFDAGLSIPVSAAGSVLLEAAQSRIEMPSVANVRRLTASIGYDYRLSKRTDVYVVYSDDKRSNAGSSGSAAVGMRHTF
jgi:predicted porin